MLAARRSSASFFPAAKSPAEIRNTDRRAQYAAASSERNAPADRSPSQRQSADAHQQTAVENHARSQSPFSHPRKFAKSSRCRAQPSIQSDPASRSQNFHPA